MGILRSLGDFRFYWSRLGGASLTGRLYLLLWDAQGQLMPRSGTRGALLVNSRGKRQRGVQERWMKKGQTDRQTEYSQTEILGSSRPNVLMEQYQL